jgi:hypothetical protein
VPYALRQKKRQKMRIYDAPHSHTVAAILPVTTLCSAS